MAVITLLSDFVDGTSMALVEDTDLGNLNDYMTQSQGKLWAGVQQRRRKQGLTTIRGDREPFTSHQTRRRALQWSGTCRVQRGRKTRQQRI